MVQISGVLGSAHSKGLIFRESGANWVRLKLHILKELKGAAGARVSRALLRGGIGMAWTPAGSLLRLSTREWHGRLRRRALRNIGAAHGYALAGLKTRHYNLRANTKRHGRWRLVNMKSPEE
jgi:hypothetical protein